MNGCIEPRRPLPVTPKNIVEVGLIKGLRRVADNETFGGAKIFAYRTGSQPSTPPTLSPALHRGGTSLVLEAPATCRRTAPAFRRQGAGPPRSAICLAVRPLALQVAAILAEAPRWYESGLGPKSVSSRSLSFVARHVCGSRHPDPASVSSANGASANQPGVTP